MATIDISIDLVNFIETAILPKYAAFGKSHGIPHVQRVVESSVRIAKSVGADVQMAYTVAAYHDLGMSGPRAIHHITGGRILEADKRLEKWFSREQIMVMKEAVEDHRASASRAPRNIYGKIVAEADRDLEPDSVFRRAVQYLLEANPEAGRDAHWKRFSMHMREKYSPGGYMSLWLPGTENEDKLKALRSIIADGERLAAEFSRIYSEETEAKMG